MSLQYEIFLDLGTKNITSLDFSSLGSKLAAITSDGFLNIWDLHTGKKYYPTPGPVTSGKSCILWISEISFICGFDDGYVLIGCLSCDGVLNLRRMKWADRAVTMLSFDNATGLLAAGDRHGVKIWKKDENNWIYLGDLPDPHPVPNVFCITSFEWLSGNTLLVTYLDNGLFVWDTGSLVVKRSFKPKHGRQIGAFCSDVQKFAAVNELEKMDIYDICSGEIWSPSLPENISFVKSIHRGSSFLAAGIGQPELVDISNTRISQILPQADVDVEDGTMRAIAAHQDETEEIFMIATASLERAIVWRTEKPVRKEINEKPWFSALGNLLSGKS